MEVSSAMEVPQFLNGLFHRKSIYKPPYGMVMHGIQHQMRKLSV